jgi:uncharacterized membrane protein YjgN (DUF898 family)
MSSQVRSLKIEQTSSVGNFVWLGFWTSLLLLPTLTLFRFWARTMFRQQLWRETLIDGESLEYIGKGSEKLLGFIIAIFTIGLPVAGLLLAAQFLAGSPAVLAIAFLVIYVFLIALMVMALFLARRYILSRTMHRGVRFAQGGSPWGFLGRAIGYGLLTLITLGWYAPVMRLKLAQFMWGNASYGDLAFSYDNSPEKRSEPVWKSFGLAWVGSLLYYVGVLGFVGYGVSSGQMNPATPDLGFVVLLYAVVFGLAILLLPLFAWHEAVMMRQITKSISIGPVALSSRLTTWELIGVWLSNALLVMITLGFGYFAAQMRIWRWTARKLDMDGAIDLAAIQQSASRGPRQGEGMADAFDISGGV